MRVRTSAALLALLAGAALPVAAQGVPNLSGTWVLQVDKSDFGPMGGQITSRTDVIEHQEPKLTIKRTVNTAAGENTSSLTYAVDGQPHKNTVGQSELSSVLSWDARVLVMVSTVSTPNGEVSITDRYTLSEDGKTLTQARTIAAQGQSVAQTMVLAKQP